MRPKVKRSTIRRRAPTRRCSHAGLRSAHSECASRIACALRAVLREFPFENVAAAEKEVNWAEAPLVRIG